MNQWTMGSPRLLMLTCSLTYYINTHVHRHNWSTISVRTGSPISCCLICSDLTPVCANAALFLCTCPSEHEAPSGLADPDMSYSTGPWGGEKAFLSFVIPVINPQITDVVSSDRESHCEHCIFISGAPRWGMSFCKCPLDIFRYQNNM